MNSYFVTQLKKGTYIEREDMTSDDEILETEEDKNRINRFNDSTLKKNSKTWNNQSKNYKHCTTYRRNRISDN